VPGIEHVEGAVSELTRPEDEWPAVGDRPQAPQPMDRKAFLVWIAAASLGTSALLVGATIVQAVSPPSRSIDGKTKVGRLPVATVASLTTGVPILAEYGDDSVYVVKLAADSYRVFDAACPHVRCKLRFDRATSQFVCPCHASSFALDGTRLRGPAARGMVPAAFEIVGGDIVVSGLRS
jgi:Rieske Fe-S protein